jgi:hypothetical protein
MRTFTAWRSAAALSAGLLAACATSIGSRVVTPGTQSITVRVAGGLLPPLPPGRECRDHTALYTIDLKTHEVTWDFCVVGEHGQRVLAPGEAATLDQALVELKVVRGDGACPPDSPDISLATTGGGAREYRADLCWAHPPVVDRRALDGLLGTLMKISTK